MKRKGEDTQVTNLGQRRGAKPSMVVVTYQFFIRSLHKPQLPESVPLFDPPDSRFLPRKCPLQRLYQAPFLGDCDRCAPDHDPGR